MMSELNYYGRNMSSNAIIYGVEWPVNKLYAVLKRAHITSVQFALEPGDATHYSLVITKLQSGSSNGWLISKLSSDLSVVKGSAVLWTPNEYEIGEAALALCNGDVWTQRLLDWWLKELFNVPSNG